MDKAAAALLAFRHGEDTQQAEVGAFLCAEAIDLLRILARLWGAKGV